MNNKL